jgi:membrane-bound metal-dependent hydrolase YbcI (DUF457 family)
MVAAANLPDVDIFLGYAAGNPNQYHHLWTHSLVFGAAAGTAGAFLLHRVLGMSRLGTGLLITGLVCSHLVLDLFTRDSGQPYGMQLFWPFSGKFIISPFSLFRDVSKSSDSRTFFRSLFTMYNLKTVIREVILTGPAAAAGLIVLIQQSRQAKKNEPID